MFSIVIDAMVIEFRMKICLFCEQSEKQVGPGLKENRKWNYIYFDCSISETIIVYNWFFKDKEITIYIVYKIINLYVYISKAEK